MSERQLVKPDLDFLQNLKETGASDIKKCFQCATCSVVCQLSPDKKPFPRKEMIWSSWGLKEKLIGNPDVWLCHQCNDCSEYCPRGVRPGDVLASIRSFSFMHYGAPKFLGKMLRKPKFIPLLLAIPTILFLALMALTGHLNFPEGKIVFSNFIPPLFIVDPVFIAVSIFLMASFGVSITRFWKDLSKGTHPIASANGSGGGIISSVIGAIVDIANHSKFTDCDGNKNRSFGHVLLLFGFLSLFIVTGIVFLGLYVFNVNIPPLELTNPVKILANIGAVLVLAGCIMMIIKRLTDDESKAQATFFDWSFIIVILAVTVSGILTEIFRLANLPATAYITYFVHLVTIFYLLAYLPFSKFAHMVYRAVAMVYARYIGREV